MLERDIQRAILLRTSPLVCWGRNNVGEIHLPALGSVLDKCPAFVRDVVARALRGVLGKLARHVAYGVGGVGGADLLGIIRGSGRAVACEVKVPGWKPRNAADRERYARQLQFLACVRGAGGLGFVASSVEEVLQQIKESK